MLVPRANNLAKHLPGISSVICTHRSGVWLYESCCHTPAVVAWQSAIRTARTARGGLLCMLWYLACHNAVSSSKSGRMWEVLIGCAVPVVLLRLLRPAWTLACTRGCTIDNISQSLLKTTAHQHAWSLQRCMHVADITACTACVFGDCICADSFSCSGVFYVKILGCELWLNTGMDHTHAAQVLPESTKHAPGSIEQLQRGLTSRGIYVLTCKTNSKRLDTKQ